MPSPGTRFKNCSTAYARQRFQALADCGIQGKHEKSKTRRALEKLLPGQAFVVNGQRHAQGLIAGASERGKRFSQHKLPNNKYLIRRVE